jgi:hypothetical protein
MKAPCNYTGGRDGTQSLAVGSTRNFTFCSRIARLAAGEMNLVSKHKPS